MFDSISFLKEHLGKDLMTDFGEGQPRPTQEVIDRRREEKKRVELMFGTDSDLSPTFHVRFYRVLDEEGNPHFVKVERQSLRQKETDGDFLTLSQEECEAEVKRIKGEEEGQWKELTEAKTQELK